MPGLAPNSGGDNPQAIVSSVQDDRLLGVDQHHRLLIRPDAFHVTVLFQPTLSYLHRIAEILPSGVESAQTSSAVLDEFVLTVYLPQLEEKVSDLFHEAVTGNVHLRLRELLLITYLGSEAFEPDPMSWRLCAQPLTRVRRPFHFDNVSYLIWFIAGDYSIDGTHQLTMCNAEHQSLPPGELRSSDPGRCHSVLSTV